MRTRHTNARRMWRCVPLALTLCFCAVPAFAQVPQATIERIVALNVQAQEVRYLRNSGQIDINASTLRLNAIGAEFNTLSQQLRQFSADDQKRANSQIQGLTKTRLALLEPQWQAQADAFKRQREQHGGDVVKAIGVDTQAALGIQRQRILLQQRRDRGEITAEDFAAEDKKALDGIMALRGKYVPEGQEYVGLFDAQLAELTRAMEKNPVTPPPVPGPAQDKAVKSDTSAADYNRDVEQAADLQFQKNETGRRYLTKEIDAAAANKSIRVLDASLAALKAKWQAAGRRNEFDRDWGQRLSALTAERLRTEPVSPLVVIGVLIPVAGIVGYIVLLYWLSRTKAGKPPVSDVYGTAHYAATEFDVTDDTCLARGLFLGKSSAPERITLPLDAPGAPVCSTPEHHTLIVARTRTGKGTRVIVPTLLRYAGSAFIIDPKGENAAITARVRREHLNQNIRVLNPWNELGEIFQNGGLASDTYNPLDILDRSDPNAVAIAQSLAAAICPAPAKDKDRFWQGSAANVLTAVFLWLTDKAGERKTLARAREIVSLSRKDFTEKYLVPMAASEGFSFAIREMAAQFIDLAPETYSGVMSNLSESTKFLSDPQVKAATATSSFSMEDLLTRNTTVYVVIPTERMETQRTWLRLVVAAAMHTFKRPRKRGDSHHRCLFLIDEFPALGNVEDMPRDIATMSGFGVDFALVVQGLDQLKDHYGEARNTILSNCAYKWFCNINDLDSAKYLSDSLGKKTVVTTSTSDSASAGSGDRAREGTTHGETARSLLNPDEILNLGKDVAIAIQPNGHPHYLRPVDYWNLTRAFNYLGQEHPSLYWRPPLVYDENPYVEPPPSPPPPPGSDGHGKQTKEKARNEGKAKEEPSPRRHKMTADEAREILGVKAGATADEIRSAYLHLMSKVHPDHGGSNYFAKELNNAKEVLMGE